MSEADTRVAAILRGPNGPHVAAFFDYDGTLIDGFSATSFLRGAIPLPRLARAALGRGPLPLARLLAAHLLGEPADRDIRFAHEAARRAGAGMSEDELAAVAARVFTERIAARLRPQLWALVQAHRRAGHRVAVVTAATRWQVEPLAASLGVDDVLCSPSAAEPLRGEAKAVAVLDYALRHEIDLAASHAYADSGDDVPFLEVCGRPCAVAPRPALARAAAERGWPILRPDPKPGTGPVAAARTLAAWSGTAAGVGTALGLAAAGLDRREAAEFGMALASRACLELAGVRVSVQGAEHLRTRPALYLFNHQSWLDVAVMARLLRRDYTGFAKHELARLPGLGDFGRMFEVVFIDRGATAEASDFLRPVLDLLARGVSVAVAPEGTRSPTPMPGPFHKGAFLAARKARVPLVPVVIRNSGRLMPRGGKTVHAGRIDVVLHPPIDPAAWPLGQFTRHIEELRDLYLSTLTTGEGCR
ncbi:HAD-IB family hydrolase [Actinospica durhamensis]|uniref:HAD-IB family hydrolase n=1 Tax=Actinospica durhamensis TaxID=1508375 RepID=A0A941EW03_9ACTN|nr:HAD-IB family hydrolase [Actinospica durhamensis]MBR7839192.1 HAD-IB family hydrolase [Actinospica durhamensis]